MPGIPEGELIDAGHCGLGIALRFEFGQIGSSLRGRLEALEGYRRLDTRCGSGAGPSRLTPPVSLAAETAPLGRVDRGR